VEVAAVEEVEVTVVEATEVEVTRVETIEAAVEEAKEEPAEPVTPTPRTVSRSVTPDFPPSPLSFRMSVDTDSPVQMRETDRRHERVRPTPTRYTPVRHEEDYVVIDFRELLTRENIPLYVLVRFLQRNRTVRSVTSNDAGVVFVWGVRRSAVKRIMRLFVRQHTMHWCRWTIVAFNNVLKIQYLYR
jgi:hypothetical protein